MKIIHSCIILASIFLFNCESHQDPQPVMNASQSHSDIDSVKERHTKDLMALPGVVGVYVGAKEDGTPCIRVMVDELTPELKQRIPSMIEGHPVEIEEGGEIWPMDRGE